MSIESRKTSIDTNIRQQTAPGSITPDKVSDELDGILDEVKDPVNITQNSGYRFVTDTEKATWNAKQAGGDYATNAALTAGLAAKQPTGDYATNATVTTAVSNLETNLKNGVPTAGDTLLKLYNMIAALSGSAVAPKQSTIAARNAYSVTAGQMILVEDDGDGKWALYYADTSGVNASYTKLSDYDILNAVMSSAQIKAAYESNDDTNAFTDAYKAALDGLATALAGKQPTGNYSVVGHTHNGLLPTGGSTGQVLKKLSATDYHVGWGTDNTGIGGTSTNYTIAELRTLSNPMTGVRYTVSDVDKPQGYYYKPDSTETDDGALYLSSAAGGCFEAVVENNTACLKWFTATDYTPIIAKLVNKGYKVMGAPGSTFVLNSVASFDKLQIDGNGCVFQVNYTGSSDFLWDIKTTAGTNYTPTAISDWNRSATATTNTMFTNIGLGGNHGSSYLTFVGNLTAAFPIGTVAKLWSVDEYVPGFGAIQKGDWLVVEAVAYDSTSNTTRIAVQGSFSYKYNTVASLRLCAVSRNKVSLKNFRLVQNVTNLNILTHIRLQGVVNAEMHNVTIENTYRAAVQVMGAYGFRATGCTFLNSQNQPPEGFGPSGAASGYGLDLMHDFGSRIEGCHFYNIRHGVTTDAYTNNATGSTTTPFYTGETSGLVVANCTAKGCAHAYDTHPWGFNISFVNCTAEGCGTAFQIRSRETRVIGGSAHRCWQPIFCVINAAQSGIYDAPIVFDGVSIDDLHPDSSTVMKISNGINSPYIIRNCNFRGGMIESTKGDMTITGCTFNMTRTGDGGTEVGRWLQLTSCKVRVMGTHVKTTASSVQGIMFQGTDTTVTVESLIFESLTATNPSIATGANGSTLATTAKLVVKDMLFLVNGPSHTTSAFPVLSTSAFDTIRIKWRSDTETATTSNENSCYFNLTGSGALNIDTVCKYLTDENIFVKANISAAASIASFPAGQFAGQRITIQNIAAFALTLPTLSSGARSLTQWQSATIVWTSTEWIYV